ncbi:DNA alkylation repair protein [Flavobacterium sp. NST-5]|uniref:DNA alkylation repair protein n=1 Tax=Flavobacterium ichthyis TaxID=2698827 RepID=A0ABW9ZA03_9FLAO|nr:DNA alkylation repair protein [Flavobacterium ichthyis]NBL64167.1 DNA alkylation repair protein [Flavobacterium ichthyis]
MSALKDVYSKNFYQQFTETLKKIQPEFNSKKFIKNIFIEEFQQMELKQRIRHTTLVLHEFLPKNFKDAAVIIENFIDQVEAEEVAHERFPYLFLPDYIEIFGIEEIETAIPLLERTTQFITCEFAIRPFILKYPEKMLAQMLQWSRHENHHVRRLASEGSRPRLPWAMALPFLKKNPEPIFGILENLKNDKSEYVRRSVANNLNDIAKDNPQITLAIAKKWLGKTKETDALVKHGCRTLLKQGHPEVLSQYGLLSEKILVEHFIIETPKVSIPDAVIFSFSVKNNYETTQTIRLEYAIYFNKANGQLSKKVFKISERNYAPNQLEQVVKKHSFKIITTRKYYSGLHKVSVIVNGSEKVQGTFILNI